MADATQAYRAYRQQMAADLTNRITAHQTAIAGAPVSAIAPLNLLADGDSWFDYPLNGILPQQTDVIAQLPGFFTLPPKVLNLAHYGDATTTLLGVTGRAMLIQQLQDPRNGTFDAILFSGGGNDMIGDQFRLWLNTATATNTNPDNALNQQAFSDILGVIQTAYLDLIATRNQYASAIPIFVHAYDYAQPNDTSVCNGLIGPWLYPSLHSRGWMTSLTPAQIAIGAHIIKDALTQFDLMQQKLAAVPANNIIRVPTLGTVDPATDWTNELHPNATGFNKITQRFATALSTHFGPRAPLGPPPQPPAVITAPDINPDSTA